MNISRLPVSLAVMALVFLASGCMDMFDPSGGSYARDRYMDPEAFLLTEKKPGATETVYIFTAQKPKGRIKLRSVYLNDLLHAPEKTKGPGLKYEFTVDGRLTVTVGHADQARYGSLMIFGHYAAPEFAIKGARSVSIAQEMRFK